MGLRGFDCWRQDSLRCEGSGFAMGLRGFDCWRQDSLQCEGLGFAMGLRGRWRFLSPPRLHQPGISQRLRAF